jgi:hypothetical protein
MTADITPIRTAAETSLAEAFAAMRGTLMGPSPRAAGGVPPFRGARVTASRVEGGNTPIYGR